MAKRTRKGSLKKKRKEPKGDRRTRNEVQHNGPNKDGLSVLKVLLTTVFLKNSIIIIILLNSIDCN